MLPADPPAFLADVAEIRYGVLRLSRRLLGERPADGLSTAKLSVLAHLYLHGPATPGHLAVTEHYKPQSLTRVLADLEADGLVARRRGERDRRQAVLAITDTGRRAIERDVALCDQWLSEALERLTETERQVLRLAGGLMARLADAGPGDR